MLDGNVLITGASSGIGLELARLFAAAGSDLILVARREDRLRDIADELRAQHDSIVRVLPADLARPASAVAICEVLAGSNVEVDILVNNAGFGARGNVAELAVARQLGMMQVNMRAPFELTRRLLPGMLERDHGGILNVASTAAFHSGPGMAVYFASKAFVLSFSQALTEELTGTGIQVTCLAPGPVDTDFAAQAGIEDSPSFRFGVLDASHVAWAGYQGLRRGKSLVVPGLRNKISTTVVRFLPRSWVAKLAGRLQA